MLFSISLFSLVHIRCSSAFPKTGRRLTGLKDFGSTRVLSLPFNMVTMSAVLQIFGKYPCFSRSSKSSVIKLFNTGHDFLNITTLMLSSSCDFLVNILQIKFSNSSIHIGLYICNSLYDCSSSSTLSSSVGITVSKMYLIVSSTVFVYSPFCFFSTDGDS